MVLSSNIFRVYQKRLTPIRSNKIEDINPEGILLIIQNQRRWIQLLKDSSAQEPKKIISMKGSKVFWN